MQPQYVGNNDFRGYLAYLAQNNDGQPGDAMAYNALQFTGNDGGIDQGVLRQYTAGATGNPADDQAGYDKYSQYVNDRYNEWNNRTGVLGASTGISSGTTGGTTQPAYDPNDLALIEDQIGSVNQGIGRLGNQRSIGLDNILNSWQESQNQLATDKGIAQRDYNTTKTNTTNDYLDTRSGIRRDAGNMYESARRLLGSAGAGRSSALDLLLPFAVGKESAARFGDVQNKFGRNQQSIDTSWQDTSRQYDEYGNDLNKQKEDKQRELEQGLLQNESGLQDQLAQLQMQKTSLLGGSAQSGLAGIAPIRDRISAILGQIDNYGKQYSGAVKATGNVAFAAPKLDAYNYSQFAAPTVGGQRSPVADYVSPLTSIIQEKDKKQLA